jgi:NADPH:quinone reductase-like Zn-dependent oxidoreductase
MLQLRSLVAGDGRLSLSLVEVDPPVPGADDVLVRVEAAPINPSDLGVMFAGADLSTVEATTVDDLPGVTATLSGPALAGVAPRIGQSLPCGNEGAGVVVDAGAGTEAQALIGKTVAVLGGAMYGELRAVPAAQCLVLHDGTSAVDAASCFVNPLTALAMIETMRDEGHTALVHTAAASNLGQMLVRICQADGVELVNIVRRPEQVELLRSLGAAHVCDSSQPGFEEELVAALGATGATIAFDATGGGRLASQILSAMEVAANASGGAGYSRYGSTTYKQVYLYGNLDRGPTELVRNYGMSWGVGGFLLTNFMSGIGSQRRRALRQRVADELHTTFASHYTKTVDLAGAVDPSEISVYGRMATGEKYLITPSG